MALYNNLCGCKYQVYKIKLVNRANEINQVFVLTEEIQQPEVVKLVRAQIFLKLMYLAANLKDKNRVWANGPEEHLLVQRSWDAAKWGLQLSSEPLQLSKMIQQPLITINKKTKLNLCLLY